MQADAGRSVRATAADRFVAGRLQAWLQPVGIRIELWNGWSPWRISGSGVGTVVFRDRWALLKVTIDPNLRFGEMYMAGRVDVRGAFHDVLFAVSRLPQSP